MNKIKIVFKSIKNVISKRNYFIILLVTSLIFLTLFILLPVFFIPENNLVFQLKVFTPLNYITMFVFSALVGLMISMQIYNHRIKKSLKNVGGGFFGSISGFVAGIFGTASCPICVAAIFGFLGTGTVFFLIEKQWYVMIISLFLILLSIYLTSLGIEKNCEKCVK